MKISTTNLKPIYELNTFSTFMSVDVDDNEDILKEYNEVMPRFKELQCKLSDLFFNEHDK